MTYITIKVISGDHQHTIYITVEGDLRWSSPPINHKYFVRVCSSLTSPSPFISSAESPHYSFHSFHNENPLHSHSFDHQNPSLLIHLIKIPSPIHFIIRIHSPYISSSESLPTHSFHQNPLPLDLSDHKNPSLIICLISRIPSPIHFMRIPSLPIHLIIISLPSQFISSSKSPPFPFLLPSEFPAYSSISADFPPTHMMWSMLYFLHHRLRVHFKWAGYDDKSGKC